MKGRWSQARKVAVAVTLGAVTWGFVWAWKSIHGVHGENAADVASIVSMAVAILSVAVSAAPSLRQPGAVTPDEIDSAIQNLASEVGAREAVQLSLLLGGTDQKIDTRFVFDPAPSQNAANAGPDGSLEQVLNYYRSLSPRRLIITGEPGAGKTVLAIQLLLSLLAERAQGDPVPVRLALTTWDPSTPVESWLARQLAKDYRTTLRVAMELVKRRKVLLVLDGLDEMDSEFDLGRRSALIIDQLNEYWGFPHVQDVVVTCRTEHYRRLQVAGHRIRNSAQIRIDALTSSQVVSYLRARTMDPKRWSSIIRRVENRPRGRLAKVLGTPWWLTLAVTVYEADRTLDPAYLLKLASGDLHDHLIGMYIAAAVGRYPKRSGRHYSVRRVNRWLLTLAAYLSERGGNSVCGQEISRTDIVLYRLWPIAGDRTPRLGDTAFCALSSTPGLIWAANYSLSRGLYLSAIFATLATVFLALLVRAAMDPWPEPQRIDLRALRSRKALPQLGFGLSVGILAGVALGTIPGIVFGAGVWFAVGLSSQAMRGLGSASLKVAKKPITPLVDDRTCGVVAALGVSPAMGLAFSVSFGRPLGMVLGLVYGIAVGSSISSLWRRYLVMLILMRGALPWRLGAFTEWAYEAGLLRISGVAYQFRHYELQEWLSRTPSN